MTPAASAPAPTPAQPVHAQLCQRDVGRAVRCLGSLVRYSRDPVRIVAHEDGSLTPDGAAALAAGLPGVTIIGRAEADARAEDRLRGYPRCLGFRRASPFGPKMFDLYLWATGDIAYCDTDIAFVRPFTGLFAWPDPATGMVSMRDVANGVILRVSDLLTRRGMGFTRRANLGLFFFRRERFDLDYIEWFLGLDFWPHRTDGWAGWCAEQTVWNGLGYRAGCRQWTPDQVVMMTAGYRETPQLVAAHCATGWGRHRLDEFLAAPDRSTDPAVAVGTVRSRRLTAAAFAVDRLQNRWRLATARFRGPNPAQ